MIFLAASRVADAGSKRAPRCSMFFFFILLLILLLLLHFVLLVVLLLLVKTKPLGRGSWTHLSLFLHVRHPKSRTGTFGKLRTQQDRGFWGKLRAGLVLFEHAAIAGLVEGAFQFSACQGRAFCAGNRQKYLLSLYGPLSVRVNSWDLVG